MTLYVNGEEVPAAMIEQEMERLRPQYEQTFAQEPPEDREKQLREWSRENVLERVLLRQAALRDGEPVPPQAVEEAYQRMVEQSGGREQFLKRFDMSEDKESGIRGDIERDMRFERFLEKIAAAVPEPAEEEVRRHYEENMDRFTVPEMVRASHVVKHTPEGSDLGKIQEEMRKVLKKLRNNAYFADMVSQHSDCPDNDGDLGFFPRGHMVQEFEDVVFGLEVGEMSEVFRTPLGFHIAKVTDRRSAAPRPYDKIRDMVARQLVQERHNEAIERFVDKEKATAKIEER